ncbi:MAG: tRNA pseudouridine(55) synthase [Eubacteriales bacterium]|nr:tRNA pseudouridine(55) synthase [Eubacteriales bacterium]
MDNSDKRQTGEGKDPVGDRTSCGEESAAGSVSEDAVSDRIRAAARSFTGEIDQIPPMYSAVKVNGKRLYDMARKGITVERKPRRITIYEICIERIELPFVTMRVRCSKGTYIRTLCEDIGEVLGTGAAMQSLLRTRVGQFTLEDAKRLDEIEQIAKTAPEELAGLIRPVDSFFADLPPAVCPREDLRLLRNGNALDGARLRFPEQSERLEKARITPGGDGQEETRLNRERNSRRHARGERADGGREEARTRGIVRVYDENGVFYGLYRKEQGRERYTAYKMFLPEQK